VTFSVSFETARRGVLEVGVTPLSIGLQALAYGAGAQFIDPGHVARVTVVVVPGALPPATLDPRDGGAGDAGAGGAADGGVGDGASPSAVFTCEPTSPSTCGAGRTCFVGCRGEMATGLCTMGGTTPAGGACTDNKDCEPGSQCFEFPCAGAATKPRMCMRFCRQDGDCGADRRCFTNVPCGTAPTTHKVCSHSCDPTGEATTGCPAGLHCFIFRGELPDCDCRGRTRTGGDGEPCEDTSNCQPGYLCVSAGPTGRTCRPLCRLDTGVCPAGRACAKLSEPDYKTFGACLPT
jgi:hypothetical protein